MAKLTKYLRDVKTEFKKVTWPSKERTKKLTSMVLSITVIWAVYISLLDWVFRQFINLFIK
ncbi:preprotein translocase subunit SecE [Microgenomates group bacterium]|nr:preprotein translocase subunit SecE [Microgenomates group bacterium]